MDNRTIVFFFFLSKGLIGITGHSLCFWVILFSSYQRKEKEGQGPFAMALSVAQQSHATRCRMNERPL